MPELCARCVNFASRRTVVAIVCFETDTGIYDSLGVVSVPLKRVLEEYFEDYKREDANGAGIDKFCEYLREYADRLQEDKRKHDAQ